MNSYQELTDSKLLKKAEKALGEKRTRELLLELDICETVRRNELIAHNTRTIDEATEQVKSNSEYVEACEVKKTFDGSLREAILPNKIVLEMIRAVEKLKADEKKAQGSNNK